MQPVKEKTFWRKAFFLKNGTPKEPILRLLFHASGRPRGVFKKYIVYPDGRPRPAFETWMNSTQYKRLPDVVRSGKEKMATMLVAQPAGGTPKEAGRRRSGKHVLLIDSELPDPSRDSGSIDTINYVTWLRALGYNVHFLSTAYRRERNTDHFLTRAGGKFIRMERESKVAEFLCDNGCDFDIFFLSRVYAGGKFFEQCRRANPCANVIFNTVDLHFLREEREAKFRGHTEAFSRVAALRDRELFLAEQSDLTIVVSTLEKKIIETAVPETNVVVMPLFRPVPPYVRTFGDRSGIGFIGGFSHTPNIDAVEFFLEEVWPLLRRINPSIRFEIAGAGMPRSIVRNLPEHVTYKGQISNLEDWFGELRLTVAPLRYGAGAKGKVASSIANGVPVVGTSLAFEGMGLGPDLSVTADHPEEMAREIARIHGDRETWADLSRSAHKFGAAHFSPEAGECRFASLFSRLRTH